MNLSRRALIIGYPGEIGDKDYCKTGVNADITNYKQYLTSLHGGAWESDEIDAVKNITKDELQNYLLFLGNFDYSLLIFSGHGGYNIYTATTEIQINKNESVSVDDLFTDCERQLFIFDCCRSIPEKMQKLLEKSVNFATTESYTDIRDIYKAQFDSYLKNSTKGIIQTFACNITETAQDWGARGGMFSYHLLHSARGDQDMSIKDVFEIAGQKVIKSSGGRQHPQLYRPRSGETFPFYLA